MGDTVEFTFMFKKVRHDEFSPQIYKVAERPTDGAIPLSTHL